MSMIIRVLNLVRFSCSASSRVKISSGGYRIRGYPVLEYDLRAVCSASSGADIRGNYVSAGGVCHTCIPVDLPYYSCSTSTAVRTAVDRSKFRSKDTKFKYLVQLCTHTAVYTAVHTAYSWLCIPKFRYDIVLEYLACYYRGGPLGSGIWSRGLL